MSERWKLLYDGSGVDSNKILEGLSRLGFKDVEHTQETLDYFWGTLPVEEGMFNWVPVSDLQLRPLSRTFQSSAVESF